MENGKNDREKERASASKPRMRGEEENRYGRERGRIGGYIKIQELARARCFVAHNASLLGRG